jgi:K+-sensing histidine kinase KdpD
MSTHGQPSSGPSECLNSLVSPESFGSLAHELRTPLAGLLLATDILANQAAAIAPGDLRSLVSTVRNGTAWLERIAENWLTMVSILDGSLALERQRLELGTVVNELLPILHLPLSTKGQTLDVWIDTDVAPIVGDSLRIQQLLVNLVSNASQYSADGLPIELSLSNSGDFVRLAVLDRGCGLSEDRLAILEPFHRTLETARRRPDGTGLGLAVVRAIVDAHAGYMGLDDRPGGGACVWVAFPASGATGG